MLLQFTVVLSPARKAAVSCERNLSELSLFTCLMTRKWSPFSTASGTPFHSFCGHFITVILLQFSHACNTNIQRRAISNIIRKEIHLPNNVQNNFFSCILHNDVPYIFMIWIQIWKYLLLWLKFAVQYYVMFRVRVSFTIKEQILSKNYLQSSFNLSVWSKTTLPKL